MKFSFLTSLLLLLAGDIEVNPGPGPTPTPTSLNFSHFNIRSASTITTTLDKPSTLHEFITDYSLDVLSLVETWLPPDTHPS